jgi:catechol 2,3-dioxygenase-like lactoylglutathione lyase family enzyme
MHLLELSLSALGLEEMRRFYVAVLGLREVGAVPNGLSVLAGATRLNFIPADPGWSGRYHFAFDVPASQFEESLAWLRQRHGLLASPDGTTLFHHQSWNADSVYFSDPLGNILELIGRRNKPSAAASNRPFSGSSLLGVSEFGIAVDSVVDATASLTTRMPGLQAFGGPGAEDFAALGDEDGLLIIVRRGRIWYPNTGVPALSLPFELLFELTNEQGLERKYRITAPPYPFTITPA